MMKRNILLLLCAALIAGCSPEPKFDDDKTLTVMTYSKTFMTDYGNPFIEKHPGIEIKLIPYPQPGKDDFRKTLEETIRREQPDLFQPLDPLEDWVKKGMLVDLDGMIKKENDPLKGFHPGILESLREKGKGRLYALTPTFSPGALFYNKALFDRYHVPYPTAHMTWEEVFRLADDITNKSFGAVPNVNKLRSKPKSKKRAGYRKDSLLFFYTKLRKRP